MRHAPAGASASSSASPSAAPRACTAAAIASPIRMRSKWVAAGGQAAGCADRARERWIRFEDRPQQRLLGVHRLHLHLGLAVERVEPASELLGLRGQEVPHDRLSSVIDAAEAERAGSAHARRQPEARLRGRGCSPVAVVARRPAVALTSALTPSWSTASSGRPASAFATADAGVARAHDPVDVQRHGGERLAASRARAAARADERDEPLEPEPDSNTERSARLRERDDGRHCSSSTARRRAARRFVVVIVVAAAEQRLLGALEHSLGLAARSTFGHVARPSRAASPISDVVRSSRLTASANRR